MLITEILFLFEYFNIKCLLEQVKVTRGVENFFSKVKTSNEHVITPQAKELSKIIINQTFAPELVVMIFAIKYLSQNISLSDFLF